MKVAFVNVEVIQSHLKMGWDTDFDKKKKKNYLVQPLQSGGLIAVDLASIIWKHLIHINKLISALMEYHLRNI